MTTTPLLLSLLAAVLGLLVIGAFHTSLRELLVTLFAPVRDTFQQGSQALASARTRVGAAAQRMRADYHLEAPDRPGSALAGVLLYALLFGTFALTEAAFNGAALAAVFGQPLTELLDRAASALGFDPHDAAGLLTVSILAQAALWFAVWTDLQGYSHLVPFTLFRAARGLRWLTYTMLGLLVAIVLALAIFRLPALLGDDLGSAPLPSTPSLPALSLDPTLLPDAATAPAAALPPELDAFAAYTTSQRAAVGFVTSTLSITTLLSAGLAGSVVLPLTVVLLQLGLVYALQALLALPQLLLALLERLVSWPFAIAFAAFVFVARVATALATPLRYLPVVGAKLDVDRPVVPDDASAPPAPPTQAAADSPTTTDDGSGPVMTVSPPSPKASDRNWDPYGPASP